MAQPVPSVSQDSSSGIWSSDVSTNKKGVPKMCSYTEYLKRKRAKKSSDEDIFEIETNPRKIVGISQVLNSSSRSFPPAPVLR